MSKNKFELLLDETLDLIAPLDMQEVKDELSGLENELANLFTLKGGEKESEKNHLRD